MKPILKLYRGYANEQELIVMGHVFKPTKKKDYDFQEISGNLRKCQETSGNSWNFLKVSKISFFWP